MSGETTVGSIVGFMRMDAGEFHREMERAIAEVEALDGKSADVKVSSSGADRVLAATKQVAAEASALNAKKVDVKITSSSVERVAAAAKAATVEVDSLAQAERRLAEASARLNAAQGDLMGSSGSEHLAATYAVMRATKEEESATAALAQEQSKAGAEAERLAEADRRLAADALKSKEANGGQRKSLLDLLDATTTASLGNDKLADSNKKAADSSKKAADANKQQSQGIGALVTAIVAVGPAAVPLAAATVGLAAGFGAMGAAGIAALVGIRHEMQTGSTTGLAYTSGIKTLTTDMNTLGTIAAKGVLGPFQSVVRDLQSKMPVLSGMIRDFSNVTGKTAANLTTGLVAAFVTLEPLMRDVGTYAYGLSTQFEHMMTGSGVKSFGDYIRSVFPQVMATVESLVGAVIHLVAAFAPLGMGVLSEIKVLSDLIGAIPVNILAELATVASSAFLGFKSFSLIKGMVDGLGSGLRSLGMSAEAAASGMAMATVAAGVIGAAVAVVTFLVSANAEANRANQQAVNDYTDALRASNGVIDESIRAKTAQMLADNGTLQLARDLHLSLMDVTSAAMGQKDAIGWVNAELNKQRDSMRGSVNQTGAAGQAYDVFNGKAADLRKQIGMNNTDLQKAIQNFKDQKDAMQGGAGAATAQAVAQQTLATGLGSSTTALQAAMTAQQQQEDSALAATTQMQLENDAAGILKGALDALNGKALSAADAQNAFDSSLANMGDHVDATGKKIHFTTTNIGNMSAASVALRGQLNAQVNNLQTVIEKNGGLANSTSAARAQMKTMRQQIIDNAVAHGVDRKAVTDYIDKLLAIPKKIPPTKLDVDTNAALVKLHVMQTAINSITGKTVSIYTNEYINSVAVPVANAARTANRYAQGDAYSTGAGVTNVATGHKPVARAGGGDIPGYAGGTLIGPGSGTSDSIMAMVAQTQQLVRLSTGEFISTDASRRRNRTALEAGNRGAQLEVAGKGGSGNVQVIVQPTPGQSETEIGKAAAAHLMFHMASAS